MTQPSPVPVRYPSGVSTDRVGMPLANFGQPNPFAYHVWDDDFDTINAQYTQTKTTGTVTLVAGGVGAILQLLTSAGANDLTSIQLPVAGFSLVAGKKAFFLARVAIDDIVNGYFNIGLMNTSATPFAPTDGLYFKYSGGTLVLASMIGSVETDLAAGAVLTAATFIDLAWYVDRNQEVTAFWGYPYVGYQDEDVQVVGPQGRFAPALTAANLNFTLAVQAHTAAARNLKVNFAMAAQER
jgi:hypothetical protein